MRSDRQWTSTPTIIHSADSLPYVRGGAACASSSHPRTRLASSGEVTSVLPRMACISNSLISTMWSLDRQPESGGAEMAVSLGHQPRPDQSGGLVKGKDAAGEKGSGLVGAGEPAFQRTALLSGGFFQHAAPDLGAGQRRD